MKLKVKTFNTRSLLWFFITIAVIIIDRVTKIHIENTMNIGEKVSVIDKFFYITHHTNKGAAWGMFHNADMTMVLGIMSVVVSIILIFVFLRFDRWPIHLSLVMIIGGAIGNAYGRIFHGKVTDFLDFYIFGYDFPIFNVADMMVTLGTAILVVYVMFFYKETVPKKDMTQKISRGNDNEQ